MTNIRLSARYRDVRVNVATKKISNKNRRDINVSSSSWRNPVDGWYGGRRKTWQRDLISLTARPETFPFFEILFRGGSHDSCRNNISFAAIRMDFHARKTDTKLHRTRKEEGTGSPRPEYLRVNPIKEVASTKESNELSLCVECLESMTEGWQECLEMREIIGKIVLKDWMKRNRGLKLDTCPSIFPFLFSLFLSFIQVLEDFVSQASFAVPRKKLKLKSVYNFTYVWRIHIKYAITKKSSQIVYNSGRYTLDLCHASLFISKMQKYAHIR